jgi:hypothetical protein
LEDFWCTNEPWTYTDSQDSPWPGLGGFPLIILSMINYKATPKCHFISQLPSWESKNSRNWDFCNLEGPLLFLANLQLRWSFKRSFSLCQELSNDMWHATYTQVNQNDSWFLVVKNQIGTLIPNLSFGNNLCFNYSNESCELIFDIFVSKSFQWYKKLFNLMIFNPWNCSLKNWESIKTLIPKVGAQLWVCGFIPSHSPIIPR